MGDSSTLRARVLIVDDEQGPRESLRMILAPGYEVVCARDGSEALEILQTTPVDLVTLDLNMPGVKGEQLMHTIRSEFPQTEIIVITGYGTLESAVQGVRLGVCDYLQKPFDVVQVTASVERALSRRRGRRRLVNFLESLGDLVGRDREARAVLSMLESRPGMQEEVLDLLETASLGAREDAHRKRRAFEFLEVLATTIESQNAIMRGHARRVAFFAGLLGNRLCLSTAEQEVIRIAAFLHDLGKVGVPTHLLTHPSALEPEEIAVLQQHPVIGARLVQPLGIPPAIVATIRHHHERWDGGGYPDGLVGEQIPLPARIVAVADAYDAMTGPRAYRAPLEPQALRAEFETCAGSQFDPMLTKEFLAIVATRGARADLDRVAEALSSCSGLELPGGAGRAVEASGGTAR